MAILGTRAEAAGRAAVAGGGLVAALLLAAVLSITALLLPGAACASRASRTAEVLALADVTTLPAEDRSAEEGPGGAGPGIKTGEKAADKTGLKADEKIVSDPGRRAPAAATVPEDLAARVAALKEKGRYLEAASLVEKTISAMEEGPEKARLQVMEAGFLAWAHEYERAIELYREVLSARPGMSSARKGLARTLSWKGLYGEAISEYAKVLEQDPIDTEARLGLARTLAWKGEYRTAIGVYRKILSAEPSNEEARLGLGRTLWWMGDREGAARELDAVIEQNPQSDDALAIRHKIRLDTGPLLSLDFVVSDDSDSSHLEIYSAGLYYSPVRELKLNLVFSQFEASRLASRARARSAGLRVRYRFLEKNTVTLRSSFLSLDTPGNPTSEFTGGVSFRRELAGGFRTGAGFSRYVLLDTVQLIENDVRVDEFFAYLSGQVMGLDMTTGIKYAEYSDDNRRRDFFLDLSRSHEFRGVLLTLGYRLDYRDFAHDRNSGYFDPSDFFAHTFYGRARGVLYGGRIEYDALAAGGLQSFNTTTESATKFSLLVKGHVTDRLTIRGGAKYARTALSSATGFRYEEYRAGLDYLF
jgi:tetratricopeptide (TPR) repeat protein